MELGRVLGGSGPCLDFPSVSPNDAGRYCVKVTGLLNSVTNCAVLTVQSNLTAIGPVDTVGCPGQDARLCTAACGLGPISYMWFKDGVMIAGANGPCLDFPSASPSDAGRYCVKVTGLLNSVINCAVLTVQSNLTAIGPVDTVGCPGQEARLCTAACGLGPITYMWFKDGVMIAGGNGSCLDFPSVSVSDAGNYCVKVTGALNSVTNCAHLTVQTLTTSVGPVNQTA